MKRNSTPRSAGGNTLAMPAASAEVPDVQVSAVLARIQAVYGKDMDARWAAARTAGAKLLEGV